MKSYVALPEQLLVVALTDRDCMAVIDGETVTDGRNPIDPNAKVSVSPLESLDPTHTPATAWNDELFKQNLGQACVVKFSRDRNIACYVPTAVLRDTRYAAEVVDTKDIIVMEEELVAEALKGLLPDNGVMIRFGSEYPWQYRPERYALVT